MQLIIHRKNMLIKKKKQSVMLLVIKELRVLNSYCQAYFYLCLTCKAPQMIQIHKFSVICTVKQTVKVHNKNVRSIPSGHNQHYI